jgi:hypothetical protein
VYVSVYVCVGIRRDVTLIGGDRPTSNGPWPPGASKSASEKDSQDRPVPASERLSRSSRSLSLVMVRRGRTRVG